MTRGSELFAYEFQCLRTLPPHNKFETPPGPITGGRWPDIVKTGISTLLLLGNYPPGPPNLYINSVATEPDVFQLIFNLHRAHWDRTVLIDILSLRSRTRPIVPDLPEMDSLIDLSDASKALDLARIRYQLM